MGLRDDPEALRQALIRVLPLGPTASQLESAATDIAKANALQKVLRIYQSLRKLPLTGKPDDATLQTLEQELNKLGSP